MTWAEFLSIIILSKKAKKPYGSTTSLQFQKESSVQHRVKHFHEINKNMMNTIRPWPNHYSGKKRSDWVFMMKENDVKHKILAMDTGGNGFSNILQTMLVRLIGR